MRYITQLSCALIRWKSKTQRILLTSKDTNKSIQYTVYETAVLKVYMIIPRITLTQQNTTQEPAS